MCPTQLSDEWSGKHLAVVVRLTLPDADVSVRLHARFCGGQSSCIVFAVMMLVMTSRPPGIMKLCPCILIGIFKLVLHVVCSQRADQLDEGIQKVPSWFSLLLRVKDPPSTTFHLNDGMNNANPKDGTTSKSMIRGVNSI